MSKNSTITSLQDKISSLEKQIEETRKILTQEYQKEILPFLQENVKYILPQHQSYWYVYLHDPDKIDSLARLIDHYGGYCYHMGCEIDKDVYIRIDDNQITLNFYDYKFRKIIDAINFFDKYGLRDKLSVQDQIDEFNDAIKRSEKEKQYFEKIQTHINNGRK